MYYVFSDQSWNKIYIAKDIDIKKIRNQYWIYDSADTLDNIADIILYLPNGERDEFFDKYSFDKIYEILYFLDEKENELFYRKEV